jgi:hypothetical protein
MVAQCLKWAGIYRYTILELLFITELHASTYQHILHPLISFNFSDGISLILIYKVYRHF